MPEEFLKSLIENQELGSLQLSYNDHHGNYVTAKQEYAGATWDEAGFISEESFNLAMEFDSVWELNVNPLSPISYTLTRAHSLERLLEYHI